jgi:TPR repeat protein
VGTTRRFGWLLGVTVLAVAAPLTAAVPPSVLARAEERLVLQFASRGVSYPPEAVSLVALKAEARLELWARAGAGWTFVRSYLVRAASGRLGPKLKEGDLQVPEGVYRIAALNPNSSYHLSLRVDYPNEFDRARAAEEGRTRLGGDIMIHGGNQSIGCLAVGDPAVEELFAVVSRIGTENAKVIVSPVDLRKVDPAAVPAKGEKRWLRDLYRSIAQELRSFALPADDVAVPGRRAGRTRTRCRPYDPADCTRRCARGDMGSCARAGLMYARGLRVPRDSTRGWSYLTKACSGGDAFGCAELGRLYLDDDGFRRDVGRALQLTAAACDGGDGHGCAYLARLCSDRVLYPETAGRCANDRARRARGRALAALGTACEGWGAYDCATRAEMYLPSDVRAARRYAAAACEGGDAGGCMTLGHLVEGAGDGPGARVLHAKACVRGAVTACEQSAARVVPAVTGSR